MALQIFPHLQCHKSSAICWRFGYNSAPPTFNAHCPTCAKPISDPLMLYNTVEIDNSSSSGRAHGPACRCHVRKRDECSQRVEDKLGQFAKGYLYLTRSRRRREAWWPSSRSRRRRHTA